MTRHIRRFVRPFFRREQGSVLLETALMLVLLLTLAFGIIDFGRVMYVSNALTNAARDAGRWAAVQSAPPAAAAIKDTVRAHYNVYTFGGPSLTQANVTVTGPTTGNSVTILVTYPFNWLTPIPRLLGWTNNNTPMTSNIHAQVIFKYEF